MHICMDSEPAGDDKKEKKPTHREKKKEGMWNRDNGKELGKIGKKKSRKMKRKRNEKRIY